MTICLSLFGFTVFQLDLIRSTPAGEFIRLGTETDLDEEMELDITAQTIGFAPPKSM